MRHTMTTACLTLMLGAAAGCTDPQTSLGHLVESRRLSAELLVQFANVNEAGHRVVMADSPEAASTAVTDVTAATASIERDAVALESALKALNYTRELEFLAEFRKRFAEFRTLDREILELAELDTNVKAQRMSFGPAQESADALRDALAAVTARTSADAWQVRAFRAEALSSIREIQALQAPHIAEADDAVMTRIEERVGRASVSARTAVDALGKLAAPESTAGLTAASAALDRFLAIHAEIVQLSRRNSNVRSLALSLGKKRPLTAACEDALRALQDALARRDIGSRRSS